MASIKKAATFGGKKGMKIASHGESLMKKDAHGMTAKEHHAKIMKTPGHGKWASKGSSGKKSKGGY